MKLKHCRNHKVRGGRRKRQKNKCANELWLVCKWPLASCSDRFRVALDIASRLFAVRSHLLRREVSSHFVSSQAHRTDEDFPGSATARAITVSSGDDGETRWPDRMAEGTSNVIHHQGCQGGRGRVKRAECQLLSESN